MVELERIQRIDSKGRFKYDYLFKIVLVGDAGVGKSSILLRFADDKFSSSYFTTIGVDFKFKTIDLDGKILKLQIWDTAGQERFRTITSAYYRGADAILIAFDYSDRNSFKNLEDWIFEINKHVQTSIPRILAGNKVDITDKSVTKEEAFELAERYSLDLIETSAKEDIGISEIFTNISKKLIKLREAKILKQATEDALGLSLQKQAESTKTCCFT